MSLFVKIGSKKFHDEVPLKLSIPKMFVDYIPSIRNLRAIDGWEPFDYALMVSVSEMRMITASDPVA